MVYGDLSSGMTGFYKYLFLPLWSAVFGWGTFQLLTHPESVVFNGVRGGAPAGIEWLFLAFWVLGTVYLALLTVRLRWVRAYDNALYASGFGHEIRIPFSRIHSAEQVFWSRPVMFRVRFYTDQGDLRTIWFMPEFTWRTGAVDPKLLDELKGFATGAQKPAA